MDTSETYIKMCDCPEIQEQAQYEIFNYFICVQTGQIRFSHINDYDYMKNMNMLQKEREYIWLPRQDQIQQMIGLELGELINGFDSFCNGILRMYDCSDDFPNSMEQLWLAFYMHEKHGKIWDGEKWITK